MPQNCSADVQAVIAHVDHVFTQGTPAQIQAVKSNFGMGDVTHLDDVAGALRNNMWDWQSLSVRHGGECLLSADLYHSQTRALALSSLNFVMRWRWIMAYLHLPPDSVSIML